MKKLCFDKIVSSAADGMPGMKPWIQRVDPEARKQLEEIRRQWVEGGRVPPAATFSRALIRHCQELGITGIARETQVSKWLRSQE